MSMQRSRSQWRKVILVLACTAAVVVIAAVGYSEVDRRLSPVAIDTPKLVVFIGDSYTHGTGSSSKALRWSSVVSSAEGWSEVNLGRGGTGYKATSSNNGCGLKYCPNYAEMVPQA